MFRGPRAHASLSRALFVPVIHKPHIGGRTHDDISRKPLATNPANGEVMANQPIED